MKVEVDGLEEACWTKVSKRATVACRSERACRAFEGNHVVEIAKDSVRNPYIVHHHTR